MDPFGSFPHSWRSWERTHSRFPIQERPQAEEVSLGPELCHLGGIVMRLKIKVFLFKTYTHSLLQKCAENAPLEMQTSIKALLSVGDCPRQYFPGASTLQRAHSHCRGQARTQVCMPTSQCIGRRESYQVAWHGVLAPKALKVSCVCRWMPNCLGWVTHTRENLLSQVDVTSEVGCLL